MRYELLHKYKKELEDGTLDKIILDKHILNFNDFIYYKLLKNGTLVEINQESSEEEKQWIKERDILSRYLTSNKSIFKNVLSNNIYTTFFKIDKLKGKEDKILTPEKLGEKYFDKIINREETISLLKDNKKVTGLKEVEKLLLEKMSFIPIDECNLIKSNFIKVFTDIFNEYSKKTSKKEKSSQIKIFYDEDLEKYKTESIKYFSLKIFVEIDDCFVKDNVIYGVPSIDISGNSKKPLLSNLTTPYGLGFCVSLQDALYLQKINLFLETFKEVNEKKNKTYYAPELFFPNDIDVPIDELITGKTSNNSNNYLKFSTEMKKVGYSINDYNVISNFDLRKNKMKIINYMQLTSDDLLKPDEEIPFSMIGNKLYDLLDPLHIKRDLLDRKKINLHYNNIEKFLQTGDTRFISNTYNTFFKTLLFDIYKDKDVSMIFLTRKLLNYKFSFENYLKGGSFEMNVENFRKNIIEKINNDIDLENDNEFLFLYGQVYYFLTSLSKSKNKNIDLLNFPTRVNNTNVLKMDLKRLIVKYGYDISLNNKKFKNTINLLFRYEYKGRLNMTTNDYLYIGLTYNNLFYIKNENQDEIEGDKSNDNE